MDRHQLIINLLAEEMQANGEYVIGHIDRDTWAKNCESIDERLSVLGLRLAFRPWESGKGRL